MNDEPELQAGPTSDRSREWFAVLAVVCLAVYPDTFNAFAMWSGSMGTWEQSFTADILSLTVRAIQVSVPVLVIVGLSKTDWKSIGIVPFGWVRDPLCGVVVWMVSLVVWIVFLQWATMLVPAFERSWAESSAPFERPSTWPGYGLLVVGSLANGFAEELVMRGYLLSRLESLLESTWRALLITSSLFAAYHIYQGTAAAVGVLGLGLIYGVAFCILRRLWPVALAHAIADVVGWLMA